MRIIFHAGDHKVCQMTIFVCDDIEKTIFKEQTLGQLNSPLVNETQLLLTLIIDNLLCQLN